MIAVSPPRSFHELPPGTIFLGPHDRWYSKLNQTTLLQVQPTLQGWVGLGETFEWQPEWQENFLPLTGDEIKAKIEVIRKRQRRKFIQLVVILAAVIVGGLIWYLLAA